MPFVVGGVLGTVIVNVEETLLPMPSLTVTFIVMIPLSVPAGIPVKIFVAALKCTQAGKAAPLDNFAT